MIEGRFVDAIDAYGRALNQLGFNVDRLKQGGPGRAAYPKNPLRVAIVMRKWARAVQFHGERRYAGGGNPPMETILQGAFAASSAANLLEGEREATALDQTRVADVIAEELRQAYDIQVELMYLASAARPTFVRRALEVSNRARGRSLIESVWARQSAALGPTDPEASRRLSIEIRIEELNRALSSERAEAMPRVSIIDDLSRRLVRARGELSSLSNSKSVLAHAPSAIVGALDARSRLQIGQAVIQYHITDRFVFAFFVPEVGPLQMQLLRPNARELHSLVQSYVRRMRDHRSPWRQTSTELYVELFSRWDHLLDKLTHLFIVPSGFLYQIPFGTLWDTRSGKMLQNRVAYSVLPHMKMIGLKLQSTRPSNALVVGIRKFAEHRELSLGEREALDVRDILSKSLGQSVTLLLGSRGEATKEQVLANLAEYGVIHLGTHGLPDRRPMLSRLIVKRGDGGDTGISALDLLELKRPLRAWVVVLSACDTGAVQPGNADDILGLPRAFLLAGTNRVIGTLWEVPEDSTAFLMAHLYSELTTPGTSISAAVVKAQQITAAAEHGKWKHPYYWGALIVVGDGTAVVFKQSPVARGRLP